MFPLNRSLRRLMLRQSCRESRKYPRAIRESSRWRRKYPRRRPGVVSASPGGVLDDCGSALVAPESCRGAPGRHRIVSRKSSVGSWKLFRRAWKVVLSLLDVVRDDPGTCLLAPGSRLDAGRKTPRNFRGVVSARSELLSSHLAALSSHLGRTLGKAGNGLHRSRESSATSWKSSATSQEVIHCTSRR